MDTLQILGVLVLVSCVSGQSDNLWREDGRCGKKYLLPNGAPAQCDPHGDGPKKGPCCSNKGFCGNTDRHCKCDSCKDYSIAKPMTQPQEKNILAKNKEVIIPDIKRNESREETKVFTISQGRIKGHKVINENGETHFEFRGIPYAQSPVGKLRFKPPSAASNWDGTFEAFEHGQKCLQIYLKKQLVGSEDCLNLNIYTKDIKPKSAKLPVMIWIHGGGFVLGSGNEYFPIKLIQENVIVVTMNYRLGGYGFLTFGNDLISGNMGLRDQAAAIQWVKSNIDFIGGDPNKITIFGESAGGMSVHAHVLSPKNLGQLAGAIAQSGTILLYGNLPSEGAREEKFADEIAKQFNCSSLLDQTTLKCLQEIDSELLFRSFKQEEKYNQFLSAEEFAPTWRPVVDNYASDPFLPINPLEAMEMGIFNNIPFISGTVRNEGALSYGFLKKLNKTIDQLDWDQIGPKMLSLKPDINDKATKEQSILANIIKQYYSNPKTRQEYEDKSTKDMFSDSAFIVPDQISVRTMSQHNPDIFNYHFTQKTNTSFIGNHLGLKTEESPVHGDDITFVIDILALNKSFSEEESRTEETMVKLWSNFAKFGNPTPSSDGTLVWNPVDQNSDVVNYMELSSTPSMKSSLYSERMLFWDLLVWGPRLQEVENQLLYIKATEFLQQQLATLEE